MPFALVLIIYNLILPLAFLFSLPFYLRKMLRRGNATPHLWQRFGSYESDIQAKLRTLPRRPLWIHAVSVGEVLVALKLVRALHNLRPDQLVVLSTTTSTGLEVTAKHRSETLLPLYRPLDFPLFVDCAFRQIRPEALILIESEIWPNTLAAARFRQIPVFLANARLSPRSEQRFRRFALLTQPLFQQLSCILTQSERDSLRWAQLGIDPAKISCVGSIKFDQENQSSPVEQIDEFRQFLATLPPAEKKPILLAGSTHPGEELLIAEAFLKIRSAFPTAYLIVVPRHFERGEEVAQELEGVGLAAVRKTRWQEAAPTKGDCLIVDTTGELLAWYHLADLVFVGKTFRSDEGQNPVEPLLVGKPIVTGPLMKNFADLFDRLVQSGGVLRLKSVADLARETCDLLQDSQRQCELVQRGQAVVQADQGAANRSAQAVLGFLTGAS